MILKAMLVALLGACPTEDSVMCVWDAEAQGNGLGTSFLSVSDDLLFPLGLLDEPV